MFVACIALGMLLCIAAVSAGDVNETSTAVTAEIDEESLSVDDGEDALVMDNDEADVAAGDEGNNATGKVPTSAVTSEPDVYVKGSKFSIRILDGNGTGMAGKNVKVKFNGSTSVLTTNSKGYAYFLLNQTGTYKLSYSFKQKGYDSLSGSKKITVVANSKSKITGSNYVAYKGASNPYIVTLTTGGVAMPDKEVIFKIKGKTYKRTTDSKGQATLNINLGKGKYTVKYSFNGVKNAKSASGSSKITVNKGMPTKIIKVNASVFKHKTKGQIKFRYRDVRGNLIPYKTIVLEINGKEHIKKTDKKGEVTFYLTLREGLYKMKARSYNTDVLKSSSKSFTIKVKSSNLKYNGFWIFGRDMKSVNLNAVAKKGVNQIFLNGYAVTLYGKNAVSQFACKAKNLGIKVHIWMETFYSDGKWISPLNKDGTCNTKLFNSIIKKAKDYASIKGVAGIHFDYLRFPGTAYKHANGAGAISKFTKTACEALHKKNPSLIVSAAIMPEPSSNKYYYGQDVPEMTKYLDMIVPMVYKGNYGKGSTWIHDVTSALVKQSNGAIVLTGLQGYYSDSKVKSLPVSQLINDADYAGMGGASGVVIFRYTLFNMIDFNNDI